MKRENRQVIAFITTLALVLSLCFPAGAVLAAQPPNIQPLIMHQPAAPDFSDISGHWGEAAIKDAVSAGFVLGYEDGTFKPDQAVTRAEFVTMVNKALQLRESNTVNLLFQDVKASDWYFNEIQKASYARYISGIGETSFMPENQIARQEAAAMLARFLPKAGFSGEAVLEGFPDAGSVSDWAKSALAVVLNKTYMKGHASGKLEPQGTLTRAEAATIIGKLLAQETIVREDTFVANAASILKDKIYVGDITIDKTVGEGDVTLENLSALSMVYVLGGGSHSVTLRNALIIQLIVAKEGTRVRVQSNGATIYETFVFNANFIVDELGFDAEPGKGGYENIIYIEGDVSPEDAVGIAGEIAGRLDSSGRITRDQAGEGAAVILPVASATVNPDGSIVITLPAPPSKHRANEEPDPTDGLETIYGTVVLTDITAESDTYCGHTAAEGGFTQLATFDDMTTAYAISTEAQLQHLALHIDARALLIEDLDFSEIPAGTGSDTTPMGTLYNTANGTAGASAEELRIDQFLEGNFVPIGEFQYSEDEDPDASGGFTGTFLGNDQIISGISIDTVEDGAALFASTSGAVIQDFTMSGGTISGSDGIGSAVGYAEATSISGIRNSASISGERFVGGIAGLGNGSTVEKSFNNGTVLGKIDESTDFGGIGGIAGMSYNTSIESSYNTGIIVGGVFVGGIVGAIFEMEELNGTSAVGDVFNIGAVHAQLGGAGVVSLNLGADIYGLYNAGAVAGLDSMGGIYVSVASGSVETVYNAGIVGTQGEDEYIGAIGSTSAIPVIDGHWLDGSNIMNNEPFGVGGENTNPQITTSFSAIDGTLSAMHTSMAAIAEVAEGFVDGAITDISFSTISDSGSFNTLQGSYILPAGDLIITVSAITGTDITVTTGAALYDLLTGTGPGMTETAQDPDSGTSTYTISADTGGNWIMVKAVNDDSPWLNRCYILYQKIMD